MRRYAARWVLPMVGPALRDAVVVVSGGRVTAIEARTYRDPLVADVITPGLVNAHAHLEYGLPFADLADGTRPFPEWLPELPKRSRTLTDADWLASARDGVRRMLAGGTTCVGDIVTFGPGLTAAHEAGLAGISYLEVVAADSAGWRAKERQRLVDLLESRPAGREVGVSPHTLYTLGTQVFRATLEEARARGLRLHTHLAENVEEYEYVLSGTGRWADLGRRFDLDFELIGNGAGVSPTRHLDALGGLGADVHVAHGVHVDAADRELLRRRGSAVALCVRSNRTLGVGLPPVAAYLAEGNPVAVGTDSLASSPDLDLLSEMRALREVARSQGAPEPGLSEAVLRAGTVGGAEAMGLREVGRLAVGCRADLALFSVPGHPSSDPSEQDPYESVLATGRVSGVLLAGVPVPDTRRQAGSPQARAD